MEAPKCKLCGERHYGLCPTDPFDFVSPTKPARKASAYVVDRRAGTPAPMAGAPATTTNTVRVSAKELAKLRKRGLLNDSVAKPKFDRTAYQREYMKEYMRKRRAKAKEEE